MTTDIKKIIDQFRDAKKKYEGINKLTEYKSNETEKPPISQDLREGPTLENWSHFDSKGQRGNITEKPPISQDLREGPTLENWSHFDSKGQRGNITEKPPISQDGEIQKDNKNDLRGNIKKTTSHGESP